MTEFSIKVIKLSQPVGDFFIGALSAEDLCRISYADIRRLENEPREVETYLGIQRPLSMKRKKELQEYAKTHDACFPTAIILAVDGKCAHYDNSTGTLTLKPYEPENEGGEEDEAIPVKKIAQILDGQHRVAGLEDYSGPSFEVNVTIFIDMDLSQQAQIFATVNLAQTKVNRSLVYDLAGLATVPSPQKVCHKVAVELDMHEKSPFYQAIKRLGVATEGRFDETLTQATFVSSLLKYISKNPNQDRDLLLRGKKLQSPTAEELKKFPLRGLFLHNDVISISKIIWAYFDAVRETWPDAWSTREAGTMLYRTNGYKAFMRAFGKIYSHCASEPGAFVPKSKFKDVFAQIKLKNGEFTTNNFPPGGAGELKLYRKIIEDTGLA